MNFITEAALDIYLGDEKARISSAGVSPERYAATVAEVQDEVVGYVGPRVLTHVPAALTHHACAIARYRLWRDKVTEKVSQEHDIAIKFFQAVQAGRYSLPLADDPDTPENESSTAGVWFSAPVRRLTGSPW